MPAWMPAKFAARLLATSTGSRPVYLRTEFEGGHGNGSSRSQTTREVTEVYAFLFAELGRRGAIRGSVPTVAAGAASTAEVTR